jgi:sulfur transfer complex TusBCD TusB component (DsrH family)
VAIYLSMHIIACMTRQGLNQLIATLQTSDEVRLIRASASQMAGRLVCEFDAPDQDALLALLDRHFIAYEWIIRAELTWGEPLIPNPGQSAVSAPEQPSAAPEAASEPSAAPSTEISTALSAAAQPRASMATGSDAGDAAILHILRALHDDSAWQIIRAQHTEQPVAVLLMHDAVLAPPPLDVPMYACEADVMARGIASPLPRLSYDQIIELIFACKRVMVW